MIAKRGAILALFLVVVTAFALGQNQTPLPTVSGTWLVDGTGPSLPWSVVLKSDGSKLTGEVSQCANSRATVEDGHIDGNAVTFKCKNANGSRVVTFVGTVNGDELTFTWELQLREDGIPVSATNRMFGPSAPRRVVAKRVLDADSAARSRPSSPLPPVTASPEELNAALDGYVRAYATEMQPATRGQIIQVSARLGKNPEEAFARAHAMRAPAAEPMKGFELNRLDGTTATFGAARGSAGVTVVTFFSPTCEPCMAGLTLLNALYPKYNDQELQVIAINTDPERNADVGPLRAKLDLKFPIFLAPERRFAEVTYGVRVEPTHLVVGPDNRIVFRHTTDKASLSEEMLDIEIRELLGYDRPLTPSEVMHVEFLKNHAVPVRSIEPADADFSDLQRLRKLIGSRRIVMLGEASHGDGATFLAKTRLIKFLHEQMGFDVLAFESGLYDMSKAWQVLQAGGDPVQTIERRFDGVWTRSQQAEDLWRYVAGQARSKRPLELTGFDWSYQSWANEGMLDELDEYLRTLPLSANARAAAVRITGVIGLFLKEPSARQSGTQSDTDFRKITTEDQARFYIATDVLRRELMSMPRTNNRDFWAQLLASNAAWFEQAWHTADENPIYLRDLQMGENLIWLATRRFPARKIIVWAASSHVIRWHFIMGHYRPGLNMGDVVHRAMGADVYTIGFSAYQGTSQQFRREPRRDLKLPSVDSLEGLIHATGFTNALVDFRNLPAEGRWLSEPLWARPVAHTRMRTDWTQVMDALFYIREMTPNTPVR